MLKIYAASTASLRGGFTIHFALSSKAKTSGET